MTRTRPASRFPVATGIITGIAKTLWYAYIAPALFVATCLAVVWITIGAMPE